MLNRVKLRGQDGSAMVSALMVMLVMLPLGLALLSIVDTQARDSGSERTRDRAFNLADSALTSATSNLGRFAWPTSGATAPSNTGATGTGAACSTQSYGATLGGATFEHSATAAMQPNLNASFDDSAYTGATWQINVCDDNLTGVGSAVWADALLSKMNYDQNANQKVWVRASATVAGRTRTLAALTTVAQTSALASKYAVMTGRMNADLTNSLGTVLSDSVIGGLTSTLLRTNPLVAADPSIVATSPPNSGITAIRCGVLDMTVANTCLTGALAATSALPLLGTLVTGGRLVQATSLTATSDANVAQLKQQAINSGTYVASTAGTASATSAPTCSIPAAANSSTIVYIEQVGTGALGTTTGGVGDQYCRIDLSSASVAYKALIIGHGRVVLRGDNTSTEIDGARNTFSGLVYALNQQRETIVPEKDSATAAREVIRIDRGAHVKGGVAADGKSAQVGIYPPPLCSVITTTITVLGNPVTTTVDGCLSGLLATITGVLEAYNPAIQSDISLVNAVKIYGAASLVTGSYRDVAGEVQ